LSVSLLGTIRRIQTPQVISPAGFTAIRRFRRFRRIGFAGFLASPVKRENTIRPETAASRDAAAV